MLRLSMSRGLVPEASTDHRHCPTHCSSSLGAHIECIPPPYSLLSFRTGWMSFQEVASAVLQRYIARSIAGQSPARIRGVLVLWPLKKKRKIQWLERRRGIFVLILERRCYSVFGSRSVMHSSPFLSDSVPGGYEVECPFVGPGACTSAVYLPHLIFEVRSSDPREIGCFA